MRWTEGHVHVAMRKVLREDGWTLIAGEYPGGSDHQLYPLCIVDRTVAKDSSPDPRRHSRGELVPDIIALRNRELLVGEAKVDYSDADRKKLTALLADRRDDFNAALARFATERGFLQCLPLESLIIRPTLIFRAASSAPKPDAGFSYLRIVSSSAAFFEGAVEGGGARCE